MALMFEYKVGCKGRASFWSNYIIAVKCEQFKDAIEFDLLPKDGIHLFCTRPDIFTNRCYPVDHINLANAPASRDDELTIIGFPKGLGISGKFSPLTFRSYASSSILTLNRFDTRTPSDFFCLENPSVGGYSGGPVFDLGYQIMGALTTTKEKTIMHGIVHGTMTDDTGGKIALITPMYYLNDII